MGKKTMKNKKEKREAGFAVNKKLLTSRWCNMNVGGVKTNC